MHQALLPWMIVPSEPWPENPIPFTFHSHCFKEEHNNEEEEGIPHPSVEQIAAQLQSSTVPCNAIASTSSSTTSASHSQCRPSLEALTLEFVRCTEKEELLTSSDKEEPLVAHGLTGKISRVLSYVPSISLLPGYSICPLMMPRRPGLIASWWTLTSPVMSVQNTSSVVLSKPSLRYICVPGNVPQFYHCGVFLKAMTWPCLMPIVTTPSWGSGALGYAKMAVKDSPFHQ